MYPSTVASSVPIASPESTSISVAAEFLNNVPSATAAMKRVKTVRDLEG